MQGIMDMNWSISENQASVLLDVGSVSISFPVQGSVRFKFAPKSARNKDNTVLDREPECFPCSVMRILEGISICGGQIAVHWYENGGMRVYKQGMICWETPADAWSTEGPWMRLQFCSKREDRVYGLGQDPMAQLDHNHQERRMWNQWGGHERSGNCGIGFFMSTGGYGMLLASPAAARFCFNESQPPEVDSLGEAMVPSPEFSDMLHSPDTASVEALDSIDIFLMFGDLPDLLRQYYALAGFPRLMPKWAYGFLQSKNRYGNLEALLTVANQLREKNIPCDGLIVDWLWFREFGDLQWLQEDWPEPQTMLAELADMGFHVSLAQHPFISEESKCYQDYLDKGYLNQVPTTKRVTYDHTNPEARDYWWQKTAELYRQGIRGYWTDMGELEEHFDGTISAAGQRNQIHNAYSLLWSMGLYRGQRREFNTRPFILSRSGCAGIQRYGTAIWSGDIRSTWQVLQDQVVQGQNMSMSGIPWWCTDIGGFESTLECTPELYIRWMEWGVFCGVFRTHGTRPSNEAWSFGIEAEEHIRNLIRLRYRLVPYIYSSAMDCSLSGTAVVQPMAYAYPKDAQAVTCTDTFLFGPSLLVMPVTKPGVREVRIYLPEGTWVHWWSGKSYGPGWHTVPAPLGEIPLFARAGAIIPTFGRVGTHIDDCSDLCLSTVPGGSGSFEFYDDDGIGFGYEQGQYLHIHFVNKNGQVEAVPVRGQVPAFRVEPLMPQSLNQVATVDCAWGNNMATITLTGLQGKLTRATLETEEGWMITSCTAGGILKEIYEPAYLKTWEGRMNLQPGETVCWQLHHIGGLYRVGIQQAKLTLEDAEHKVWNYTARWDDAFLSDPWILACLPLDALDNHFAPEQAPEKLAYAYDGKLWAWQKDSLFAHNSFGYVDFRRFNPPRKGEEISGVAWSKENLYSKEGGKVDILLGYDSPVTMWLNGEMVFCGGKKSACAVPLSLELKPGNNCLILRQVARIPRPYSGGEFGYQLRLVSSPEIYAIK